jgi:hypothetical protein
VQRLVRLVRVVAAHLELAAGHGDHLDPQRRGHLPAGGVRDAGRGAAPAKQKKEQEGFSCIQWCRSLLEPEGPRPGCIPDRTPTRLLARQAKVNPPHHVRTTNAGVTPCFRHRMLPLIGSKQRSQAGGNAGCAAEEHVAAGWNPRSVAFPLS